MTDISFTVAKTDLDAAMKACLKVQKEIDAATVTSDDRIGRVSLVGAGMKSSPGSPPSCSRRSIRTASTLR